jgi:hypothetical protein
MWRRLMAGRIRWGGRSRRRRGARVLRRIREVVCRFGKGGRGLGWEILLLEDADALTQRRRDAEPQRVGGGDGEVAAVYGGDHFLKPFFWEALGLHEQNFSIS